eukprot:m.2131 g.2131  ORF g.2131 m.2131 type:complete len:292 (+) comp8332_c0_seq1:22-897(+)
MKRTGLSERDSSKLPFIDASEERIFQRKQALTKQKVTIERLEADAKLQLVEREHQLAYTAGSQLMKATAEAHGMNSVHLVSPYVIIGRAALGLGKVPQAEKYLSQAQWILLKHPGCDETLTSLVCRHLGLLYAFQGNYEKARKMIADDIYHATIKYGMDSVRVASGYYHLGNTFTKEGHPTVAMSLYNQVIQMYIEYFKGNVVPAENFDKVEELECVEMLHHICKVWEENPAVKPESLIAVYKCLALLYNYMGNKQQMTEFADKALQINELLPSPSIKLSHELAGLKMSFK